MKRALATAASTIAAVAGLGVIAPTAQAAASVDGYKVLNTVVGSISQDSQRIPVRVNFICPAGEVTRVLVRADQINVTFHSVIDGDGSFVGFRFGAADEVTCTGRRQTFEADIISPSTPLTSVNFQPSRNVQITTQVGPAVTNQVVRNLRQTR